LDVIWRAACAPGACCADRAASPEAREGRNETLRVPVQADGRQDGRDALVRRADDPREVAQVLHDAQVTVDRGSLRDVAD
jgi:hypothetical protein